MMTQDEMQAAVDALAVDMAAKGLRIPEALIRVVSQSDAAVAVRWAKHGDTWASEYMGFVGNGTLPDQITAASAWVAALPTPEERATREIQAELAKLIDMCNEANMSVDFLNPLTEMAKRLSENAITDQRGAK